MCKAKAAAKNLILVRNRNISKDKFKDDWRYIGCDTWRLDKLKGSDSPEDEWIAQIDAVTANTIPFPAQTSLVEWIEHALDPREYKIVYDYVWMGKSMAVIGDELGITRVRVWQLYQQALRRIKVLMNNDAEIFKDFFIGREAVAADAEDGDGETRLLREQGVSGSQW